MRLRKIFGLHYNYDIVLTDKEAILEKINTNANLSFSFLVLLVSSSIICTLGLLLNSAPVVIGGMIISPLMWPLVKTSIGISNEDSNYIRHAIILLIIAILVTFVSSAIITYISPLKSMTEQILVRTSPTLLDLVIALAAGSVAALAITQQKISESLAGVAIATSLMPPLCVSGIGLALFNYQTFLGGFLLFLANAVAIIFMAVIIFYFIGIKRRTNSALRKKWTYILIFTIILLSVPLYFYLKSYTFKAETYKKTQEILIQDFQKISPSITVTNVSTSLSNVNGSTIKVQAQILVPQNVSIDYNQQQQIITDLQEKLNKQVDLTLNIQQTISILSEEDLKNTEIKQTLQQLFVTLLNNINPALYIDSLITTEKDNSWNINATLHADPSIIITQADKKTIEDSLSKFTGKKVTINLWITPLVQLQSDESIENQKITQDVQESLETFIQPTSISNININSSNTKAATPSATILINLTEPPGYTLPDTDLTQLKEYLQNKYKKQFLLQVNVVNEISTTY